MHIKILQWNIWYKEDIEKIAETLKQIDADIICLQELTIGFQEKYPDTIAYLSAELGAFASFHEEMSFVDETYKQANAILSRFPLGMQRSGWINETIDHGRFDDEYRAYIETVITLNGKDLKIGTVHMSYTKGFAETERKRTETDRLISYIENNADNFLLLGDLNALPESYTIRELSTRLKNAGPGFNEKTWTTKPFEFDDFKAETLDWRLDYAFVTPDIKVVSAEVVTVDTSDHLPILVTIDF